MKSLTFTFFISLLAIASCSDRSTEDDIQIRIENTSIYKFENVLVDTNGGSGNYGDIDPGDISKYKTYQSAYRYAFIELQIQGDTFTIQPIDYVGETLLDEGKYTYELDAEESGDRYTRLTLTFKED